MGGRARLAAALAAAVTLTAAGSQAVSEAAAAPNPKAPAVKAGSVWTLWNGGSCETESFGRHTFSALSSDSSSTGGGDGGTYTRQGTRPDARRVVMTWTTGPSAGAVFHGRFSRSGEQYSGPDVLQGTGTVAHLEPASALDCPLVTTGLGAGAEAFGNADSETVTVTGSEGVTPTGAVDFWVCPGEDEPCGPNATGAVELGTIALHGSGDTATAAESYDAPATGPYCFADHYVGDAHYASVFDASTTDLCYGVSAGTVMVTTSPATPAVTVGSPETDSATVTAVQGTAVPTGTMTFSVCGPLAQPTACTATSGTPVGDPVSLTPVARSATATSPSFTPAQPGTYCFVGVYSGNGDFTGGSDDSATDECFAADAAAASLSTAPATSSLTLGDSITDTATVTGQDGITPTGTVHFYVCPPAGSCTGGSPTLVDLGTSPLTAGAGTRATVASAAYDPPSTGDYCFLAAYSGDADYAPVPAELDQAECFSVTSGTAGTPLGIVALNKVGPHEVLGGGTGTFVVAGDVFLDTDVRNQPWSGSYTDPATDVNWEWDDAIDAKTDSNIYVYGTIHSSDAIDDSDGEPLWPLDTCFSPDVLGEGDPGAADQVAYAAGDPEPGGDPTEQLSCTNHGAQSTIDYDNIDPTQPQIDDPLQAAGAPPDPLSGSTDIACPGSATSVFNTSPTGGDLEPGEYTEPVEITSSATFEACPDGAPGIYRFDQGLWIDPGQGDSVTGNNVVLATESPYPMPGNVPGADDNGTFVASGSGNGAPCLPSGTMTGVASGNGSPMAETSSSAPCGGTDPTTYGVVAYGDSTFAPDTTMSGTGENDSLLVGGSGTVTLTGPTTGAYGGTDGEPGLVLYQDPDTQANYGFDADAGDSARITVNGVVYNASLSDYGADAPLDYWDGSGGGIPFYAGGTVQAGYGTGWSDGPAQSSGSVTLDGSAVVDDFETDGNTDFTILAQPYAPLAAASAAASNRRSAHHRTTGRTGRHEQGSGRCGAEGRGRTRSGRRGRPSRGDVRRSRGGVRRSRGGRPARGDCP